METTYLWETPSVAKMTKNFLTSKIFNVSSNCLTFYMRIAFIFLVVLFLFSYRDIGNQATKRKDDPLADRFQLIEGKLQEFADKHDAKISTVWSKIQTHDPDESDSFLVKHIVWNDGRFGKAVFIQQHSDINGVDTTAWDFSNIAWIQDTQVIAKPTYVKNLLTKVNFKIIERDIQQLLSKSEEVLSVIKMEDLK